MIDVGTLVMKVDADTKKFNQGLSAVNKGLKSVGGMVGKAAKTAAIGATVAAGAMAAMGVSAVNAAKNFDEEMSKVQAITESTASEMKILDQTAQDLGATTAFSAKEAAEGMSFLGMAGFETNEIIAAMPGLLDLAAASGTDLGMTADIVSDAMTAFGLSAEETGRFADVLAKTSAKANTNVEMLGESFKYAAPVAGTFGFSIEDTAAALGIMANNGIKASQAGTALRTMMTKLSAGDSNVALKELGVEAVNADGSMRDLGDVIMDMQEAMKGLSQSEAAQLIEEGFGRNAMSGILSILNDTTGEFKALNNELENSEGAAKSMAKVMLDNLAGDLTLLQSATEGAKIQIGKGLTPAIRDLIQWVTRNISNFTDAFLTAFNSIRKFIDDKLVPVFKTISKWWENNSGTVKAMATSMFDKIKEGADTVYKFFENSILPVLEKVYQWWETNGKAVGGIASDVFGGIVEVATTMWKYISESVIPILETLASKIIDNWPEIKKTAETTWNGIKAVIDPVVDAISKELIDSINDFEDTVNTIFPALQTTMGMFFNTADGEASSLATTIQTVTKAIQSMKDLLPEGTIRAIEGVINPAKAIGNGIGATGDFLNFMNEGRERNMALKNNETSYGNTYQININGNISDERSKRWMLNSLTEELKRTGVKP